MSSNSGLGFWLAYLTLAFDLIMVLTHHLPLYYAIVVAVGIVIVVYYMKEIKHVA